VTTRVVIFQNNHTKVSKGLYELQSTLGYLIKLIKDMNALRDAHKYQVSENKGVHENTLTLKERSARVYPKVSELSR
jgi:hypothetical protein